MTDVTIANSVRFSWSRSKEGSNGGVLGGSSVVIPDPCGELDAGQTEPTSPTRCEQTKGEVAKSHQGRVLDRTTAGGCFSLNTPHTTFLMCLIGKAVAGASHVRLVNIIVASLHARRDEWNFVQGSTKPRSFKLRWSQSRTERNKNDITGMAIVVSNQSQRTGVERSDFEPIHLQRCGQRLDSGTARR